MEIKLFHFPQKSLLKKKEKRERVASVSLSLSACWHLDIKCSAVYVALLFSHLCTALEKSATGALSCAWNTNKSVNLGH